MSSSGIEHADLTGAERERLHSIAYVEVSTLLNGNEIRAEDIGRDPWPRHAAGIPIGLLEIRAQAEEYRTRFEYISDLVSLLDVIGWDPGEEQARVYFYPPVVRALRFCKAVCDRENRDDEPGPDGSLSEVKREEKDLVDNLLAVADGD